MECHTSQGRCFTAPCRVYVTGELCFLSTPTPSAFPLKRIIKIYIYMHIVFNNKTGRGVCRFIFQPQSIWKMSLQRDQLKGVSPWM